MFEVPHHVFGHIFSFIDDEQTRHATSWSLSVCNKEMYLTLPVCLNTNFLYAHQVRSAQLTEDCACMLLEMNRIPLQIYAWSEKAAEQGWSRFLYAMYEKGGRFRNATQSIFVIEKLIQKRRLDIIKALHPQCMNTMSFWDAFDTAIQYGYMEMVEWLHSIHSHTRSIAFIETAARFGQLDMVKFLHKHDLWSNSAWAMDKAAMHGHYHVLVYLHEHKIGTATPSAMDKAAAAGFLDIVQFLHENRTEGCTRYAIDDAAKRGHEHIVRFLNENRKEGFTRVAFEAAAVYPEIAAYLRQYGKNLRDF